MTKQKNQTVLNSSPENPAIPPALSKQYINPLTGSSLVEQAIDFKDLISSVLVKNTQEQTRVAVKLYSPINNSELAVTFFPRIPVVSFKIGIPDFVKFNLYISLTEDFSKYVVIENINFYPAITGPSSSSTAYTESAKIATDVYKNAIFNLLAKYSLEEFLATLPEASIPYDSNDFNAKVSHFYERSEFADLFFKVQLATSKGTASYGVPNTPATGRVGIGISDIDTRITAVYHNTQTAYYDISTIFRSSGIRSLTLEFFVFAVNAYGHSAKRTFSRTLYPDGNGNSGLFINFLEFTNFNDYYLASPYDYYRFHVVHIAKLTTAYGSSVDFNLYPVGSQERTELLARFVTPGFDPSIVTSGAPGPTYLSLENPAVPYVVNNVDKAQPRLVLRALLTNGVDFKGVPLPIPYRNDLLGTPQGILGYHAELLTPYANYGRNLVPVGLFQKFNVPVTTQQVSFTPLSYAANGAPNKVRLEYSLYFTENPGLFNGLNAVALYKRTLSTALIGTPALICSKIQTGFSVARGAIKQFTLKAGTMGRTKKSVIVRRDANKTINTVLPECRVFLRRYAYRKVGKIVSYVPDAFLAEGILRKTATGGVSITDVYGNQLAYYGYVGKRKDLIILVGDFTNLQSFYGFSLGSCLVKDYVELARITV